MGENMTPADSVEREPMGTCEQRNRLHPLVPHQLWVYPDSPCINWTPLPSSEEPSDDTRTICSYLENYGRHFDWCERTATLPCTCGFDAALSDAQVKAFAEEKVAQLLTAQCDGARGANQALIEERDSWKRLRDDAHDEVARLIEVNRQLQKVVDAAAVLADQMTTLVPGPGKPAESPSAHLSGAINGVAALDALTAALDAYKGESK